GGREGRHDTRGGVHPPDAARSRGSPSRTGLDRARPRARLGAAAAPAARLLAAAADAGTRVILAAGHRPTATVGEARAPPQAAHSLADEVRRRGSLGLLDRCRLGGGGVPRPP